MSPTPAAPGDGPYSRGQRVIYTKLCRPVPEEHAAMVLRAQFTAGRLMYVIQLDHGGYRRQVSPASLRPADNYGGTE